MLFESANNNNTKERIYGGCGVWMNMFDTRQDCIDACIQHMDTSL